MKGISPLVAAVLLIAATMSIAGILAYWASSFVRSSLPSESNRTDVECAGSNFNIYTASYNTTTKNFTLMLENTGMYNVKIAKIDFIYADLTVETHDITGVLPVGGSISRFVVSDVTENYQKYRVVSNCPQLVVER